MLLEKINADLKDAMKNKDKDRLDAIRLIKTSLMNEKIKLMVDNLSEEQELAVLAKEVKQRKDSITEFSKASRLDLIEKEEKELKVIETYLPKQLTKDEVTEIVNATILELNASSIKEMGKVMSALSPKVRGKADMGFVNTIVKELLNK